MDSKTNTTDYKVQHADNYRKHQLRLSKTNDTSKELANKIIELIHSYQRRELYVEDVKCCLSNNDVKDVLKYVNLIIESENIFE